MHRHIHTLHQDTSVGRNQIILHYGDVFLDNAPLVEDGELLRIHWLLVLFAQGKSEPFVTIRSVRSVVNDCSHHHPHPPPGALLLDSQGSVSILSVLEALSGPLSSFLTCFKLFCSLGPIQS